MNTDARCIYRTQFGSFTTWEAAAEACERADFDPCEAIEIVRPDFQTTCIETAYGANSRLSFQIAVF
jgi:hypothetical protein